LISQSVASDYPPNKQLHCGNCDRDFLFKNALPLSGDGSSGVAAAASTTPATAAAAISSPIQMQEVRSRNPVVTWAFGLILLLMLLKTARPFMATLKGPEFLFFYGFVLIASIVVLAALRNIWEDSMHVTFLILILFEAIGVTRFIDGSNAGMHKFSIMFVMMGMGGIMMFARSDQFSSNSSSSNCGSSCGSSCSGCGGGGGCGGCGG